MAGGVDQDGHKYHFELFGFPVHVGWTFWIWPVLAGLDWRTPTQIIEWVAVVFASVLFHELGHALALRRYGSPARIELWSMGGLTYGRQPRYRWQDVVVSLAGPVPPLVLIGLPAYFAYNGGIADNSYFWFVTLRDIWFVNLFWSLVNLAPLLPLDGGRVVDKWFGRRPARITSIVTGTVLTVLFFTVLASETLGFLALIMTGINIYIFTKESQMDLRGAVGFMEAPGGMQVGGPSSSYDEPLAAKKVKGTGRRRRGKAKLQAVPSQPSAPAAPDPREPDAWAALQDGDVAKAEKLVKKLKGPASPVLLGAILARQGKAQAAVAAYGTGILNGNELPPVGDRILAEADLAGPVADWITSSEDGTAFATLTPLYARLQAAGHARAAAEVGEARAGLAVGLKAGRAWYETACSWAQSGEQERALSGLRAAAELGFATADMLNLEPAFAGMHGQPEFDRILASLR